MEASPPSAVHGTQLALQVKLTTKLKKMNVLAGGCMKCILNFLQGAMLHTKKSWTKQQIYDQFVGGHLDYDVETCRMVSDPLNYGRCFFIVRTTKQKSRGGGGVVGCCFPLHP
jgi:hypothetical protein